MTEKEKQLEKERKVKKRIILLIILYLLGSKPKYLADIEISTLIYEYASQLPQSVKRSEVVNALVYWASEYMVRVRLVQEGKRNLDRFLSDFAESEPKVIHVSDNNFVGSSLVGKQDIKTEVTESTLYSEIDRQMSQDERIKRFEEALKEPTDLYILSTHAHCSHRCFPDQGKVVSKTLDAKNDDMLTDTYTKNGSPVYSLKAMLSRVDSKGYHNFIISGFNCKHHLIPFFDEGQKPKIEEEEAESDPNMVNKRRMEWQLRRYSDAYAVYIKPQKEKAVKIKRSFDELYSKYVAFCGKHGLIPELWRCK